MNFSRSPFVYPKDTYGTDTRNCEITATPIKMEQTMPAVSTSRDNPTVEENRKQGTVEWQLQNCRFDDPVTLASFPLIRRLRSSAIEGYASKPSVLPGDAVDFMVSMDPPGRFTIDLYRMGYYGGTGGRHMGQIGPFQGDIQPVPMMTIERLRECAWEKCITFTIPDDWPSGVYLGKLTRDEFYGAQSYVIFVVREHRKTDILCQVSDLTWQAYNKWPGRDSLYDDGTPEVWYGGPNVRVSFDRPYTKFCTILDGPLSIGSGEYLLWEHPMTFWLEQQGYDVTYCSNMDVHLDPGVLTTCKVFLSVAHDEYWSQKMFDEVTRARDDGMSIAFFSGNSVCFEVELYDSSVTGDPCRAFSRKGRFTDEDRLMGVQSPWIGYGDWLVTRPDHWVYEGTDLKAGDKIRGIIGWEYHGIPAQIPGLEVVAEGPLLTPPDREPQDPLHSAVVYPGARGNWVFNAGTIWWSEGLSCPPGHIPARNTVRPIKLNACPGTFGVNPLVQRITTNVLDRMLQDSPRR